MSNKTDETTWAGKARLVFVEQRLWWHGELRRADVTARFGVSPAQASSDISRYLELNPGAAGYNTRRKIYEGTEGMVCILHEPGLDDILAPQSQPQGRPTQYWPRRCATKDVQRKLVIATRKGKLVRLGLALAPNKVMDLNFLPSMLDVWEGRWYFRAWFVAGPSWITLPVDRIITANWPQETSISPPVDPDVTELVEVVVRLAEALDPKDSEQLQMDYNLTDAGTMKLRCRRAFRDEVVKRLPRGFELAQH